MDWRIPTSQILILTEYFRKAGFLYLILADIIHLQARRRVKDRTLVNAKGHILF